MNISEELLNSTDERVSELEYWLENVRDHACDCPMNEIDPTLHFDYCPYRNLAEHGRVGIVFPKF